MNLFKSFKTLLCTSAVALGAFTTPSQAAVVDIPLFGSHAQAPGAPVPAPRTDNYSFQVTGTGGALLSVLFNSNLNASYALYSGAPMSSSPLSSGSLFTGVNLSVPLGSNLAGLYTLSITSSLRPGSTTGFYNGALTVSSVPEAGELLMFSAGLAAVAAVVRRRKARAEALALPALA